jgi:hypothetical protein
VGGKGARGLSAAGESSGKADVTTGSLSAAGGGTGVLVGRVKASSTTASAMAPAAPMTTIAVLDMTF